MTLLDINGITKRFGGITALNGVSLSLEPGKIVGIIGPNGAGKTTLFNAICGFYIPDEGKVVLEGNNITGMPPEKICKLGIGRTFQIVKPFKTLTVFENIKSAAIYSRRVTDRSIDDYCGEILAFSGLTNLRNQNLSELTIAATKKVETARALATNPKVILLDEVLSGLNPVEVEQGVALIRSIAQKGIGILIIEHLMKAIMSVCERIVVLQTGTKIAEGTPQEVSMNQKVVTAYLGETHARDQ